MLMHDIHPTTVDGQAQLISQLKYRGCHLVTVPAVPRHWDGQWVIVLLPSHRLLLHTGAIIRPVP